MTKYSKKYVRKYVDSIDVLDKHHSILTYSNEIITSLKLLNKTDGIRVLDLGCGSGIYWKYFGKGIREIVGVDNSELMLEYARENGGHNVVTVRADLKYFFKDKSVGKFDFIMSIGVLGEHVYFNSEAVNFIYKHLNPGGVAFFTVVDADYLKPNWKSKVLLFLAQVFKTRFLINLVSQMQYKYFIDYDELKIQLNKAFKNFYITYNISSNPKWKGSHFLIKVIK